MAIKVFLLGPGLRSRVPVMLEITWICLKIEGPFLDAWCPSSEPGYDPSSSQQSSSWLSFHISESPL